ncbi:MAG: DUF2970 domain-containing protein [Pseudomonadales bacterium]
MADSKHETPEQRQTLKPTQVIGSVLASAFGVQSSRNRKRDFTHGKPSHFIIAGLAFTAAFGFILYLIVQLVLST